MLVAGVTRRGVLPAALASAAAVGDDEAGAAGLEAGEHTCGRGGGLRVEAFGSLEAGSVDEAGIAVLLCCWCVSASGTGSTQLQGFGLGLAITVGEGDAEFGEAAAEVVGLAFELAVDAGGDGSAGWVCQGAVCHLG